jgi:hypothetical protein
VASGVSYLNPGDPGTYRAQRGRTGADDLMAPDVGIGGRYVITTGEAATVNGGTAALPRDWRRVFDPNAPACAVLVFGVIRDDRAAAPSPDRRRAPARLHRRRLAAGAPMVARQAGG